MTSAADYLIMDSMAICIFSFLGAYSGTLTTLKKSACLSSFLDMSVSIVFLYKFWNQRCDLNRSFKLYMLEI